MDGSITNTITRAGDYGIKNASGPHVRLYQRLENAAQYNGRLLTLSVLKGSSGLSYHTMVASGWTETTDILGAFGLEFIWLHTGDTWFAAKLELGSQQTLAHQENGVWVLNEIPDYGEQLRRCQRYFVHPFFALGVRSTGSYFTCGERYPVDMRTTPSLIGKVIANYIGSGATEINGLQASDANAAEIKWIYAPEIAENINTVLFEFPNGITADL